MKFSKARPIARLFLLVSSLLTKAVVKPHGIEVRYCHTRDGMLRVFVEHWHCKSNENTSPGCQLDAIKSASEAGTMIIRDDTDGIGEDPKDLTPAGFVKFEADREFSLPGCDGNGHSTLAKSCENKKDTNAWVYYDFPLICDKLIKYTFLEGTTQVLEASRREEQCTNGILYKKGQGLSITGSFQDENPPDIYVNGELCDENTVIYRQTDDPSLDEAVVNYSYHAKDDCVTEKDIDITVSPTDKDTGSTFELGPTTVTITADDKVQSPATCTFQVIVEKGTHAPTPMPSPSPSETFGMKTCAVWPDPHFKPFSYPHDYITNTNRNHYDFHYGCDVVFVKNRNVEIHLRLEEQNQPRIMSIVRSVGVKIGDDILQVTSNPFKYYVNDLDRNTGYDVNTRPFPNNSKIGTWDMKVFPSKPYLTFNNNPSPTIELSDPSKVVTITIQQFPRDKNLLVDVSGKGNEFKNLFSGSKGMCSHVEAEDRHVFARDGTILTPEPGIYQPGFGEEWQVIDTDTLILSDPNKETNLGDHAKICSTTDNRRLQHMHLRNQYYERSLQTSTCEFCQNLWNPVIVESCEFDASVLGCDAMDDYIYTPAHANFFSGGQPVFGEDFPCVNSEDFFFNDEKETCQWIQFKEDRRNEYCKYQTVRVNCPLSCGLCCENDDAYTFTAKFGTDDTTKDCDWLGKKEKRQEKYCGENDDGDEFDQFQNGKMIRYACPKSCKYCVDRVSILGE